MRLPGYKILRKINQGGMSTVYLAVQTDHNRVVALKVMAPALNADPIFGERFQREAKIISQLAHPNIIAIHDVGQYKTINYIAMDFMDMGSVASKIKSGLTAKESLHLIKEVSLALDHAHAEGYVHRDIKPENILIGKDDKVVLTDFGVARSVSSNTQMTSAGTVLGTPNYMSPEQARGKELDGRSDIYSLGIVLYEMLAGAPPFQGEEAVSIAIQHLTAPLPKLPAKFAVLQPLVDKMTAKKPQDRFQNGAELADTLDQVQEKLKGKSDSSQELDLSYGKKRKRTLLTSLISKKTPHNPLSEIATLREAANSESAVNNSVSRTRVAIGLVVFLASTSGLAFWYWNSYQFDTPITAVEESSVDPQNIPIADAPPIELVSEVSEISEGEIERPQETEIPITEPVIEPLPDTPPPLPTYPLTINIQPADTSYVRIMNIVERYQPGIRLPSGEYHVVVGAPGYWQEEHWITLDGEAKSVDLNLAVASQPGDLLQHQPLPGVDGPEMIVIPPGEFIMGDLRYSDTQPRHSVIIEKPFAISSGEVRFAEYDAYLNDIGQPQQPDEDWGRNTRPAIHVSWRDAKAYADWLAEKTSQPYRLPTEAEWEYIASSGGLQEYPWSGGAEDGKELANCRGGCRSEYNTLFISKTAPVRKFSPNTFGVYDLAGNVAEWTATCYLRTYDPVDDPEPPNCERVVRGGSFMNDIEALDVFRREHYSDNHRDKYIGFRVVLDLPAYSDE